MNLSAGRALRRTGGHPCGGAPVYSGFVRSWKRPPNEPMTTFPANEYLRIENGEPGVETLTAQTQTGGVCSGWNSSLLNVVAVEIIDALSDTEHRAELESLLRSHFGDWSSSPL